MRQLRWAFAAAVLASGCSLERLGLREEPPSSELEAELASADRRAREDRTLSDLASLEKSINDYVRAEGNIPAKLDQLIPKYAAEIPSVDAALPRHRVGPEVAYYPADVIRDGVVDGTRLRDTGRWGYVFNDRQVILFIDCTHQNSRKRLWYQERGVY